MVVLKVSLDKQRAHTPQTGGQTCLERDRTFLTIQTNLDTFLRQGDMVDFAFKFILLLLALTCSPRFL